MATIEYTRANMHHIGADITLIPGRNEVDDKAWQKAAKNWLVKHFIEAGHIRIVSAPAAEPDKKKA